MCKQNNIPVKYYIYDEIENIARIKKDIIDGQGVISEILTYESREEKALKTDIFLTGRNNLEIKNTISGAINISYIPALVEYYLIVYKIIQPTFNMSPFFSLADDKHLIISSVEDQHKKSSDAIDEFVCTCLASDLGVSKLDIDVNINFAEYGMSSIYLARLYSQIVEKYGEVLEPIDVIEAKNAKQIIEVLKGTQRQKETNKEAGIPLNENRDLFTASSGNTYELNIEGEGEPLMFLTALAFLPDIWKYQKEYWQEKYRMIFLCLPGHGNSKTNGNKITFQDIVNDINEVIDYLKLDSVNIIGWCMAGNVLQKLIAMYPQRVKKACLICTTPEDASLRGVSSTDLKEYSEDPLKTYELEFGNIFGAEKNKYKLIQSYMEIIRDAHCQVDPIALVCYINELFKFNIINEKSDDVNIPVLIIAGKWDITYPSDQVAKLKTVYTNSRFELFDNSGHMPFISESLKFNHCIEEFLK